MADYSVEVDQAGSVGVTATLLGLDDMVSTIHTPDTLTTDTTVHVPGTVTTDTTVHVPEPITTTSTVDATVDATVGSTVTSTSSLTSNSTLDVEPLALDQCLRIELGALPPTRFRSPWHNSVALSVLGVELLSVEFRGESSTYVEPVPRGPIIAPADQPGAHGANRAPDAPFVIRLGGS